MLWSARNATRKFYAIRGTRKYSTTTFQRQALRIWDTMLTRIEIDGFKTFERFELDLQPFSAVVGPNASGKSNLFDALRFLSALSQTDIRTAMQNVRGEPAELFRRTSSGEANKISFAIEVLLNPQVEDAFGQGVAIDAQRLRYELHIARRPSSDGDFQGVFLDWEDCRPIKKADEGSVFARRLKQVSYAGNKKPFIRMREQSGSNERGAIEIRQDGSLKRGRPITLAVAEASRTALSTITTTEFPHLYALKDFLSSIRFLQIDPQAARRSSDRFSGRDLAPDASNLAAVLARLQSETASTDRPQGAVADVAADLASLIPSVRAILVQDDQRTKEYAFDIELADKLTFSSRVISDGTLRLLALLTLLNDPKRKGILCFEEPENGVHEGRIPQLVSLLRNACTDVTVNMDEPFFQILTNTHSPAVMASLQDNEIIAADVVTSLIPTQNSKSFKTRMRTGVREIGDLIDPEKVLTRFEIDALLRRNTEAA